MGPLELVEIASLIGTELQEFQGLRVGHRKATHQSDTVPPLALCARLAAPAHSQTADAGNRRQPQNEGIFECITAAQAA